MVNLEKQARNKKNIVLISSAVISLFFVIEMVLLFKRLPNSNISLFIGALGLFGILSLKWLYLKDYKYLIKETIKNIVEGKLQNTEGLILNDFLGYLRKSYVFLPRDFKNKSELLRVERFFSRTGEYRDYTDSTVLKELLEDTLTKNKEFRVLLKELWVDIALFLIPMFMVQFSVFQNKEVLILVLCVMRVLTFGFYFKIFSEVKNKRFNFEKIENLLFSGFEDESRRASMIELDVLNTVDSKSVFFLIDSPRRGEVEDLIKSEASGWGKFTEWSIISEENFNYKNNTKLNKACILFPSEMLFPFVEMQEFISAFDKVIVIDSAPSYAISDSEIFYLDQNQEVKKIHFSKNFDRLSGDKGLILRNFRRNNLDLFLTQVEMRVISKQALFLVYADVQDGVSHDKNFVYPLGFKMVSMLDSLKGIDQDFICDLSQGNHIEKMERAKNFVANHSYHNICSKVVVERKLKKLFRVS